MEDPVSNLFRYVWYGANVIVLVVITGYVLWSIGVDLFSRKNSNESIDFDKNPLHPERGAISLHEKRMFLENELGKVISLIALITALSISGIIYVLAFDPIYEFLRNKQQEFFLGDAALIIAIFSFGTLYARFYFIGLGKNNDLYRDQNKSALIQRSRGIKVFYLSTAFFFLLSAYIDDPTKEINLLKACSLAFIAGNGFYIVFRSGASIDQLVDWASKKDEAVHGFKSFVQFVKKIISLLFRKRQKSLVSQVDEPKESSG